MSWSRASARVTSPGRLQLIGIEPTVLVDAAHNPHGASRARATPSTEYFDFDEWTFVIGVLADKDAHGHHRRARADRRAVPCRRSSSSDRAIGVDELAEIVLRRVATRTRRTSTTPSSTRSSRRASGRSRRPRRAVVVTGSITLVGDAMPARRARRAGSERRVRRSAFETRVAARSRHRVAALDRAAARGVPAVLRRRSPLSGSRPSTPACPRGRAPAERRSSSCSSPPSRVLRYRWGIAIGWVLQAALIALGILVP